jgi:hypothetical protein
MVTNPIWLGDQEQACVSQQGLMGTGIPVLCRSFHCRRYNIGEKFAWSPWGPIRVSQCTLSGISNPSREFLRPAQLMPSSHRPVFAMTYDFCLPEPFPTYLTVPTVPCWNTCLPLSIWSWKCIDMLVIDLIYRHVSLIDL